MYVDGPSAVSDVVPENVAARVVMGDPISMVFATVVPAAENTAALDVTVIDVIIAPARLTPTAVGPLVARVPVNASVLSVSVACDVARMPSAEAPVDVADTVPAKLTDMVLKTVVALPVMATAAAWPPAVTATVPPMLTTGALNVVPEPKSSMPDARPAADTVTALPTMETTEEVMGADTNAPNALAPEDRIVAGTANVNVLDRAVTAMAKPYASTAVVGCDSAVPAPLKEMDVAETVLDEMLTRDDVPTPTADTAHAEKMAENVVHGDAMDRIQLAV
jgi:hypothetical protein